ncbi:hypothetical protein SAMN05421777_12244 [Fluoribacter gormanii]|uniref:Uncharacterized protein n=1 Tax=Fluoribacter gormanii TaxID=464 RepID=A0A377GKF7_9GAMM|nr:hypothetical protein SAMN05421777_12244 [Fluoribacter gormanii]STO25094.1 Uncharacterised protein [Fluoribacter gormanii]
MKQETTKKDRVKFHSYEDQRPIDSSVKGIFISLVTARYQ